MTPSWSSAATLGGLAAALMFAVLCYTDMRRAILVLTAVGCVRGIQIGAFSGSEIVAGLLPVEILATVLVSVWVLKRLMQGGRVRRTSFNTPLFLLIPSSLISLLVGFTWFDPNAAIDHMKLAVSLGQILLIVWAIGTYLVVANSVYDDGTIERVKNLVITLAVPSLLWLVPSTHDWPVVGWTITFALAASSLCFAEFFYVRSVGRKAWLLLMTIAPAVYGFTMGKAFFYAYVIVSCAVIGWFKARRATLALASPIFAAYVVLVPIAEGSLVPHIVREAVEIEEQQESLGGSGGRDQLILDGLHIWLRYPIFGVGPGNNYPYMIRYSTLGTAHNQFVNVLIEQGVIGLGCFLIFGYRAARMGLALWNTVCDPRRQVLVLAWLGMFAAMFVGGFFGDFMIPSVRNDGLELFALYYVQWIVLGLVVSIGALERADQAALSRS